MAKNEKDRTPNQINAELRWALASERLGFVLDPTPVASPEGATADMAAALGERSSGTRRTPNSLRKSLTYLPGHVSVFPDPICRSRRALTIGSRPQSHSLDTNGAAALEAHRLLSNHSTGDLRWLI